jgi:hypothetical protein
VRRPTTVLALLAAVLGGCVTVTLFRDSSERRATAPPPPPPREFDHRIHVEEAGLSCAQCHIDPGKDQDLDLDDPAVWTGREPILPAARACFECHEPDESDDPGVTAFFGRLETATGRDPWDPVLAFLDLKFSHGTHVGEVEMECTDCHRGVLANSYLPEGMKRFKQSCFECHDGWQGDDGCSSCHDGYRKNEPPWTHSGPDFRTSHGLALTDFRRMRPRFDSTDPHGWGGDETSCSFCHTPRGCNDCHAETKPRSHEPLFLETHGQMLQRSRDDASCSLCHAQEFCSDCHQNERPRSHTQAFVRFDHSLSASMDRTQCSACHTQNFCQACHESIEPRSHRGSFASRRQSHCLDCHEPLAPTGCGTCHKTTAVHRSAATPMPNTPPHRISNECKECHERISHVDDGDGATCRRCHVIR